MLPHYCHAIGCRVEVPARMLMCMRHWRMVPYRLQREVYRTYRTGQEIDKLPSDEWRQAADNAINSVKALEGDAAFAGKANSDG